MPSGELVEVVIFDQSLYRPTGLVGKWMRKLTLRFEMEAKKAAPKLTGRMASEIYANVHNTAPKVIEGTIASPAPYTLYVIHGTGFPVKGHGGRIYTTKGFLAGGNEDAAYVTLWGVQPRGGKFTRKGRGDGTPMGRRMQHRVRRRGYWLKLPFIGRNGRAILTFSVRGQEPNNFMEVAWRRTANNHKVLRRAYFPRF